MQLHPDALPRFGYMVLGTRLKRLAEQLQAGVAEVFQPGASLAQIVEFIRASIKQPA